MARRKGRRRKDNRGQPWFDDPNMRIAFEGDVRSEVPDLEAEVKRISKKRWLVYKFKVAVPHFDLTRQVEVRFRASNAESAVIFVDGPDKSKHRYPTDGSLCIWSPNDPPSMRWMRRDGLAELVAQISVHLFEEEWYRRSPDQVWLSEEAPHVDQGKQKVLPR